MFISFGEYKYVVILLYADGSKLAESSAEREETIRHELNFAVIPHKKEQTHIFASACSSVLKMFPAF